MHTFGKQKVIPKITPAGGIEMYLLVLLSVIEKTEVYSSVEVSKLEWNLIEISP